MKKFLEKNIHYLAISLIAIILIGYIYLDNTKNAHDMPFHLANIQNLMSNNLKISLIMPNIGNNLGYGLYIFYPMLPHLIYAVIASMLSFVNINLINSILITNILISIVSTIFMYKLALNLTNNKRKAFISAIIYLLFPYRLGTITVRMALSENFALIFLPIILLGLYYLYSDDKKKFYIAFIIRIYRTYIKSLFDSYVFFNLCINHSNGLYR